MDLREQTIQVIARILGETAYIFVEIPDENPIPDPDKWDAAGVSLRFYGSENGEMRMWASRGFARCVAANMLGIDEEDETAQEKGLDALKESLNIILGNYITTIYGVEPVFDLGLPEPLDPAALHTDLVRSDAILLTAEDYPVLFVTDHVAAKTG